MRSLAAVLAAAMFAVCAAADSPAPVAPGQDAPNRFSPTGEPADEGMNGRCGVERWGVKTLSDPDAASVDFADVVDTSVHALITNPPQSPWSASQYPADQRALSGPYSEVTVYRIHGLMTEARREADHDYHAVIMDPNTSETMIVEFPDPACPGADSSAYSSALAASRAQFEAMFGAAPSYPGVLKPNPPPAVVVTGVRFFDPIHGQDGVAPNGVELHPALSIAADAPLASPVPTVLPAPAPAP